MVVWVVGVYFGGVGDCWGCVGCGVVWGMGVVVW